MIRTALPADLPVIGPLIAEMYLAEGLVPADAPYVQVLLDATDRASRADLLVALDPAGALIGSVTFALGGTPYADLAAPGEAEFRMLGVSPLSRGSGVGRALVLECISRARTAGSSVLRLSTGPRMVAAHRMYEGLGFRRTPARDWLVDEGRTTLRTYALDPSAAYCDQCGRPLVDGGHHACGRAAELDPPRWCAHCRRRMTVQVTPTGWTARCVEHGTRSS